MENQPFVVLAFSSQKEYNRQNQLDYNSYIFENPDCMCTILDL